ncbi:hypothetical protein Vqi01_50060 [Micromonospora qiuiae]|uniref:Uncharacterized protein n=1 Tax=Micromonospora qiuiae TaxID=502268 RepID=A0ABQ4JJY1_9ACTN|nr:hypothetical protein [Micromonospora qiuiae]GIJ29844.1 hypothetical protein Vqi01_50060 [Micromonospora qiuiae]
MPRPRAIDLTADRIPWRRVPMLGAELGLDLVPLESDGDTFTLLARFPAGFVRDTPGGYLAAEEFFVLDGHLEFEGEVHGPGELTHVPARFLRTSMQAPQGCTVLAWFGGPAIFRTPEEISPTAAEPIISVDVRSGRRGEVLLTSEARWRITTVDDWPEGAEAFDLAGRRWARAAADWPGEPPSGDIMVREPVARG